MKRISLVLILLILTGSLIALAGCTAKETGAPVSGTETARMEAVADGLAASIDRGLLDIRAWNGNTARALASTGLSGPDAEEILSGNILHYPWAVSSFTLSKEGIVRAAVPEHYAGYIGTDLSGQEDVRKNLAAKEPGVSALIPLVEGFSGVVQSYPVFSSSGEYLGYTDITYVPAVFLSRYIEPVIQATGYNVWVAQDDGTQLYDANKEEIGKNIVSDPMYADPALHEVLKRIAAEPKGTGSYSFYDSNWNRMVTKVAAWDTAGIDGARWRVVVIKEVTGDSTAVPTAVVSGGTTDARYAGLKAYVEKAAAFAKEHGKEAAVAEFNNVNGTFTSKELYIFAYEMDGTVIALPFQQGALGTNRREVTDTNGVAFIERMIGIASEGGGFLYYIYPNPADNYREELKISYILPVDGTWFVGSGIYLPEIPATFNMTERDVLIERVKQARRYAEEHGMAVAVAGFNDRNGTFADGSKYIFAYGFDGTTLAMPFQPESIGTNRMDFTDTYGVKVAAWEIAAAKRGGGFVYVHYYNPDTGSPGIKLCYVAPVGNTWLVGSGIYTDRL